MVVVRKSLISAVTILVMIYLVIEGLPILNNVRYSRIIDQMDCGVSLFDVKVEVVRDDRGGITMDGITLYKIAIKDNSNLSSLDFSEWKDLPINSNIADYYMVDSQPAGGYLRNIRNGSWKIVGKNIEGGMYRNIILYAYDEDGRCFYAYKWDS